MKFNDIRPLWYDSGQVAILSLPFMCYAVEVCTGPSGLPNESQGYVVSYKGSFPFPMNAALYYKTKEDAKEACENYLKKLVLFLFDKLSDVLIIEENNTQIEAPGDLHLD
ncbi:MAG: hypothetical protein NXI00_19095 [Cytophagales bacterium]|nr:hypothetical protein [Cytophagales bacterium]